MSTGLRLPGVFSYGWSRKSTNRMLDTKIARHGPDHQGLHEKPLAAAGKGEHEDDGDRATQQQNRPQGGRHERRRLGDPPVARIYAVPTTPKMAPARSTSV